MIVQALIQWLATPDGSDAFHAVLALITATAAVLSALAMQLARENRRLLHDHRDRHNGDAS